MSEKPWDQLYAERATYVLVCFTTDDGRRVCLGVPGWEPPRPEIPVPIPEDAVDTPPWPLVSVGEDPRPVPWVRDLHLLSTAVVAVSRMNSPEIVETLRQQLLIAAEEITKDAGVTVHLHG